MSFGGTATDTATAMVAHRLLSSAMRSDNDNDWRVNSLMSSFYDLPGIIVRRLPPAVFFALTKLEKKCYDCFRWFKNIGNTLFNRLSTSGRRLSNCENTRKCCIRRLFGWISPEQFKRGSRNSTVCFLLKTVFRYNFRPEVVGDVMSGVAVD